MRIYTLLHWFFEFSSFVFSFKVLWIHYLHDKLLRKIIFNTIKSFTLNYVIFNLLDCLFFVLNYMIFNLVDCLFFVVVWIKYLLRIYTNTLLDIKFVIFAFNAARFMLQRIYDNILCQVLLQHHFLLYIINYLF